MSIVLTSVMVEPKEQQGPSGPDSAKRKQLRMHQSVTSAANANRVGSDQADKAQCLRKSKESVSEDGYKCLCMIVNSPYLFFCCKAM